MAIHLAPAGSNPGTGYSLEVGVANKVNVVAHATLSPSGEREPSAGAQNAIVIASGRW
jgi:hypothetical protein